MEDVAIWRVTLKRDITDEERIKLEFGDWLSARFSLGLWAPDIGLAHT